MATKTRGIFPDLLIHPGETIADIIEERHLTQKELAKRAGVSEAFLSDVIRGKKDISKALAMGLEYGLEIPHSFWLNLQANYNAEALSLQESATITDEERTIRSKLRAFIPFLQKRDKLPAKLTVNEQILALRKYFKVSTLVALENMAPEGAFRLSEKAKVEPVVLGAWLCLCKAQGALHRMETRFHGAQMDTLVAQIKDVMCHHRGDPRPQLTKIFAENGIDFSIVQHFQGAPVQGYIARKPDGTYQMVLTIRRAFADIFWFSLFHELGHIVNGDVSKTGEFIDTTDPVNKKREEAADLFAKNALLHPAAYQQFVSNAAFTSASIQAFAETQGIPDYMVIGRLQKEGIIPYSWFAAHKCRYKWAEE